MDIESYLLGKKASGGGITPSGIINITANGETNVTNYATANVNVQPNLESKSVTITQNTTTVVEPTSGKDGLSSVTIVTNVSSGDTHNWSNIGYSSTPACVSYAINNYPNDAYDCALAIKNNIDALGKHDNLTSAITSEQRANAIVFPNTDFTRFDSTSFLSSAFADMSKLEEVPKIVLTAYTSSIGSLFSGCTRLTKVDLSGIDFSHVGQFSSVFSGCTSLKTLDLSSVNTSNSISFMNMFFDCNSLTHITFGANFTMAKLTNPALFGDMFSGCSSLDDETLNNIMGILATADIPSGSSSYKRLYKLGFSSTQTSRMVSMPNWSALESDGWTQ